MNLQMFKGLFFMKLGLARNILVDDRHRTIWGRLTHKTIVTPQGGREWPSDALSNQHVDGQASKTKVSGEDRVTEHVTRVFFFFGSPARSIASATPSIFSRRSAFFE